MAKHMIYPLFDHANECSTVLEVFWDGRRVNLEINREAQVISPLDAKELALALYQFYLDNKEGVL